jgi:general secretion pathway protein D
MLYSRERSSLSKTTTAGSVLTLFCMTGEGGCSGMRCTLQVVKEANESSMVRGKTNIHHRSTNLSRALALLPLLLCLFALAGPAAISASAQSASTWDKRGQVAESHDDFDAAYEDYRQAHLAKPNDLRYKAHFELIKFKASVAHVDRGRVLKASGDPEGALTEFTRALQYDPSNQTAQQEIDLLRDSAVALPTPPSPAQQQRTDEENRILARIGSVSGPIELQPVSNDPITIRTVEDVKAVYQAIGKLAGLNVLFDPDYTSKRIPVDLNGVSLSDALRIVGTVAGTFYKPITPNTIFVAANTRQKHTDLDQEAVQTFYLSNVAQQNDANEIVTSIRNLLDPSVRVNLVPSQNAIIMRATPDQLLLAQKVLNDLDRARPEVVVDVAVLEVNRDKMRNLGITLPQSMTITPQASPNLTTNSGSTPTNGTGTTTTTSSNFTLNSLAHLNATNFAVSITGGTVNALLNDTDTRILQNPRIRATDGQRATLKIGQRIPIATGSYSSGVATGTVSLGVQTQFTFTDVGVNIDMTPTVHYDREVSIKIHIEVSAQQGSVTISGVTQPIIGQNVSEQTIQLKEGEPSILAGLIQTTDTKGVAGTPGLGEIPFFKYFFSSQSKETQKNEIVFLLIPHIVRESVLSRLNTRVIDTGTGQSMELRRDTTLAADANQSVLSGPTQRQIGAQTTAANAAAAAIGQLREEARPLAPGQPPPAPVPATAGPPISLSVVPASSNQTVGSTFQVAVMLGNGRDVYAVPLQMQFNPAVLQLVNVDAGDFLARDGQPVSIAHRDDEHGIVTISSQRPPNTAGISGQGTLCTLTFKAIAPGDSSLSLVKIGARNSTQANLPAVGSQAVVHVK